MTHAEIRLIEEAWQSLVERLGWTEATRFVMLLDRRTGGALQHLQELATGPRSARRHHMTRDSYQPMPYFEYAEEDLTSETHTLKA